MPGVQQQPGCFWPPSPEILTWVQYKRLFTTPLGPPGDVRADPGCMPPPVSSAANPIAPRRPAHAPSALPRPYVHPHRRSCSYPHRHRHAVAVTTVAANTETPPGTHPACETAATRCRRCQPHRKVSQSHVEGFVRCPALPQGAERASLHLLGSKPPYNFVA